MHVMAANLAQKFQELKQLVDGKEARSVSAASTIWNLSLLLFASHVLPTGPKSRDNSVL